MRNVSERICRGNQNSWCCDICFPKIVPLSLENVEKYGTAGAGHK
jgi:hypothetical protein